MKSIKLENWSVVCVEDFDPYKAPELYSKHLCGEAWGHPRFQDGSRITTSSIVGKKGSLIITKSGSQYEPGKVDPAYEAIYPEAKERLFNSLKGES